MTQRSTQGDGGRRLRRFVLAGLIAAALAAAMSGCTIIKSVTPSQLNVIGKVQITTTACASDTSNAGSLNSGYNPVDPACQKNVSGGNPNAGGNYPGDASDAAAQYKIAYRIPNTASSPSSLISTAATCNSGIIFNQSASYTSALQGLSPAGSGKQWVGYLSTVQNYTNAGCQYFTVAPQFTLNQSGGNPFQGPFNYRVVVGFRQVDEGTTGNTSARTVTCGTTAITSPYADGVDGADSDTTPDMAGICADDPTPATISGTDLSQSTQDLGVVPTNISVNAGATANVPFNLKWAGANSPVSFNVGASTTVPGTTATPSITSITPLANSNNNMTAQVNVPSGTAPGTYNVTVTATGTGAAAGQTRSGTATLTVGGLVFNPAPALPSLGTVALNGQAQTKNATMPNFGVNDTTSTHTGWNVTVSGDSAGGNSAVFAQYCPPVSAPCGGHPAGYVTSGFTLPANSLTLNSTGASWSGGTSTMPTFNCGGGSCGIDSATPTKIGSAINNGGTGLWTASGFTSSSLSLFTPSTLRVPQVNEQYRLNIIWSLNTGP